jgi:hypothetical protein
MRAGSIEINEDHAYLLVIGDLHMGDKAFGKESRKIITGYIDWIKRHDNARIILNGDLLNCATRVSKTSPFEQDMTLEEQVAEVAKILAPVKDKIVGAVMGNHCKRIADFAGYDPTLSVLSLLGLPIADVYFKHCGILKVKVGKRNRGMGKQGTGVSYTVVFHHTTGGGSTIGSKLNRIDKMRTSTISNADIYFGSHNHSLSAAIVQKNDYNPFSETVEVRDQHIISCGGYLEWNGSYAEAIQLEPMKIGSPRVRLDGKKKDIRVSLWSGEWE